MKWRPRLPASLPPRRALILGKIVFLAGAILVLRAVVARRTPGAIHAQTVDPNLPALRTLAQAEPH